MKLGSGVLAFAASSRAGGGVAASSSCLSIQFVAFETMLDRPLIAVQQEYNLVREAPTTFATPDQNVPVLLAAA